MYYHYIHIHIVLSFTERSCCSLLAQYPDGVQNSFAQKLPLPLHSIQILAASQTYHLLLFSSLTWSMIRGTGFSIVSFEVKNFSCLSLKGALNKSFGQHVMAGNMAKPAKTRPFPVAREGTFRPTRYITVLYPSHCPAFKEFRAVPYWVSNIKIFSTMSVRLVHIFHPER